MTQADAADLHEPVLLAETLVVLKPEAGGLFVDATVGLGGHSEAILDASSEARVVGIDRDERALELARGRLARFGPRIRLVRANFSELRRVVGDEEPAGILADLGVSSLQLDEAERGFSFRYDAPLDMRMDTRSGPTAADLLATLDEKEIADLIYKYGEERHSRRIARRIVERRSAGNPVTRTGDLAELVRRAVSHGARDRIHPATRTFQALRIAVNNELDILGPFIDDAVDLLKKNGALAVITFHSLEDRIVKHAFQRLAGKCVCPPRAPICRCGAVRKVQVLTRKPVSASASEAERNPRSRSAKLRACRKL